MKIGSRKLDKIGLGMDKSSYWFAVTTTSALVVLFVAVLTDISLRAIGLPVIGIPEFSALVMIVIVYGGLAYGQSKNAHVSVDWFFNHFNQKTQVWLQAAVFVIILAFLVLVLYATGKRFIVSLVVAEKYEGLGFMPMWPARFMIFLGILWFWFQILIEFLRSLAKPKTI